MSGIDGDAEGNGHARGHMHSGGVDEECAQGGAGEEAEVTKVGRRRQVIGILVLQLGIMIHSLVIGLTLSITTGSEFSAFSFSSACMYAPCVLTVCLAASLVIAIVFHQLFEGLSLGIRIAGLPSSHHERTHTSIFLVPIER